MLALRQHPEVLDDAKDRQAIANARLAEESTPPITAGQESDPASQVPTDPAKRAEWLVGLYDAKHATQDQIKQILARQNASAFNPVNVALEASSAVLQNVVAATGLPDVASAIRDGWNVVADQTGVQQWHWGKGTIDEVDWSGDAEPGGTVGAPDASSFHELTMLKGHLADLNRYIAIGESYGSTAVDDARQEDDLNAELGMAGQILRRGVSTAGSELKQQIGSTIERTGIGAGGIGSGTGDQQQPDTGEDAR
jgi:hypothetical protein